MSGYGGIVISGNGGGGSSTPAKLFPGDVAISNKTSTTAPSNGSGGAIPSNAAGYLHASIGGTEVKIPYFPVSTTTATPASQSSGFNATQLQGVNISSTAPAAGQVLQATNATNAAWATLGTLLLPATGLRLQYGTVVGSGSGYGVSFPVAFSGTPAVVLGNNTGSCDIHTGSISDSGFALDFSSGSQTVCWVAIGPS
jgi:hypothetical protein